MFTMAVHGHDYSRPWVMQRTAMVDVRNAMKVHYEELEQQAGYVYSNQLVAI